MGLSIDRQHAMAKSIPLDLNPVLEIEIDAAPIAAALGLQQDAFLRLLEQESMDLTQDFSLLKVLNMKTSARNQWVGTISAIRAGAVNDEVELRLPGGARLVAIITRDSTEALALQLQQTVIALVKSSAEMLATELGDARLSARNRLEGRVLAIKPGAVNAEVTVETADGLAVVAIVAQSTVADLGLAPDVPVAVLVKAADIILAVAN